MAISSSIQITAKVGEREVLTSGVAHVQNVGDLVVSINNLNFRFIFKSDGGAPRYEGRVDGDMFVFELSNHNNSLGEGLFTPLDIAVLNGRIISMTYCVSTVDLSTNARRLEYAFYQGKEE